MLIAQTRALLGRRAPNNPIGSIDRPDPHQALQPDGIATDRSFEEVASAVGEAADKPHAVFAILGRAVLEDVVDVARVGLQIPAGTKMARGVCDDLPAVQQDEASGSDESTLEVR